MIPERCFNKLMAKLPAEQRGLVHATVDAYEDAERLDHWRDLFYREAHAVMRRVGSYDGPEAVYREIDHLRNLFETRLMDAMIAGRVNDPSFTMLVRPERPADSYVAGKARPFNAAGRNGFCLHVRKDGQPLLKDGMSIRQVRLFSGMDDLTTGRTNAGRQPPQHRDAGAHRVRHAQVRR